MLLAEHLVEDAFAWPLGDHIVGCSDETQLAALALFLVQHRSGTCRIVEQSRCSPQTIVRPFTTVGRFVRQTSEPGRFGIVELAFEPCESTGRLTLEYADTDEIPEQMKNDDYAKAMLNGIRRAAAEGRTFGSPATNFRSRVLSGKFHFTDSSPLAFAWAASLAFEQMVESVGLVPVVEQSGI